jgi:hypothetical protein
LTVRQHEKEFETCGFDLKKMVQRFKAKIMGNRLSVESVESVLSIDNPEREKMKLLVKGMPLYPVGQVPTRVEVCGSLLLVVNKQPCLTQQYRYFLQWRGNLG